MLEKWVARFVDSQIAHGSIKAEDRNIYKYGYQVLAEYCLNLSAAVLIAFFFRACGIVLVFTIAYMAVRSYAGGYHAKTTLGCFLMSAIMLIGVILAVRAAAGLEGCGRLLIMEILLLPYIFIKVPIPIKNRPLSENEKRHFGKAARMLCGAELAVELLFLWRGKELYALSILAVHLIIFLMAAADSVTRRLKKENYDAKNRDVHKRN